MKRILSLITLVAILVTALVSCDIMGADNKVAAYGEATVVVELKDGSYETYKASLISVQNKKEGAKGVLEHLNQRDDKLHLVMEDSTYGAFVTEIGSIKQDGLRGEYIIVYTSLASDSYEGAPSVNYNGTVLYQSGLGLSSMTVNDGTVILFRIETY